MIEISPTQNTKKGFILLLKAYFWIWVSYIAFFVLLGYLKQLFPEIPIEKYQQSELQDLIANSPLKLIILAAVMAPIFEELMFRSLIKPTHPEILLFLSAIVSFVFGIFAAPFGNWILRSILMFVILSASYYLLQEVISENKTQKIREFLSKYVWAVLISTSIIFGVVHINNYVDSFTMNLALFLLVVPRIIIGFIAGRLKWQSGAMLWPILLHFLNNAFVIVIALLGKGNL